MATRRKRQIEDVGKSTGEIDSFDSRHEWKIISNIFNNISLENRLYFTPHFFSWIVFLYLLKEYVAFGRNFWNELINIQESVCRLLLFMNDGDPFAHPVQLETATLRFQDLKKDLKDWHILFLNVDSPVELRLIDGKGIGVIAKDTMRFSDISDILIGYQLYTPPETYDLLKELNYPSLISEGILYGPLSLVNHCCDSQQLFKFQNGLGCLYIPDTDIDGEVISESDPTISTSEEITVNYGNICFNCLCRKCLTNTGIPELSEDINPPSRGKVKNRVSMMHEMNAENNLN